MRGQPPHSESSPTVDRESYARLLTNLAGLLLALGAIGLTLWSSPPKLRQVPPPHSAPPAPSVPPIAVVAPAPVAKPAPEPEPEPVLKFCREPFFGTVTRNPPILRIREPEPVPIKKGGTPRTPIGIHL